MKYDNWQQQILDASGHILLNKGRQIGGTTIFAHKAGEYMVNHKGSRIVVVSLTLDQAENIITMINEYLTQNYKKLIAKGKNKPTKTRIALINKSKTISRPVGTTGNSIRSFTGDILFIDEGALMARAILIAAKPILFTTAGHIWMTSTPFGKFEGDGTKLNYFYEAWLNEHDKWNVFEMDTVRVSQERKISKDWTEDKREGACQHLKEERKEMTELEFGQEYLHLFADELRQWFPDELIRECMKSERTGIQKNREYYLGVDIARMGEDESSFEIIDMRGDILFHIENQITTKTLLSQTQHHIKELHRLYDFSKIFIDDEGIGVGVLDFLIDDDETKNVTIGINNSKQIIDKDGRGKKLQKTLLYSNLKMLMETGKINLLDEPNVFQSLKSVQYAYTNDSLGTRHLKLFGNYTHIAEGLVRAAWCVKYKDLNPTVYTIRV